jgi:hypothetical protein
MGGVVEKTVLLLLLNVSKDGEKSYNHGRIIGARARRVVEQEPLI